MTNHDDIVDNFCSVLYKLNVYGYCPELGDEPIDTLFADLRDYWLGEKEWKTKLK